MFDANQFDALSPNVGAIEAEGLALAFGPVEAQDSSQKAARWEAGVPDWFHPLPPVRKRDIRGNPVLPRSALFGRTMPLKMAKSLKDVDTLRVEGAPSIAIFLGENDNATITITRRSRYWEYYAPEDINAERALVEEMVTAFRHYSNGPYSLAYLRQHGHPYGYGPLKDNRNRLARRAVPRNRHVRNIRGAVPDLNVTNRQSGQLMQSWHGELDMVAGGNTMRFWNDAKTRRGQKPYPWYLIAGTGKMQPHSPANRVPVLFLPRINSLHMRAVRNARSRSLAINAAISTSLGAEAYGY